jgi:hypothetical protein
MSILVIHFHLLICTVQYNICIVLSILNSNIFDTCTCARPFGILNPYLREDSTETLPNVRFLFDSEDLLDTASSIHDVTLTNREEKLMFGMIKIQTSTTSLSDLMRRYANTYGQCALHFIYAGHLDSSLPYCDCIVTHHCT